MKELFSLMKDFLCKMFCKSKYTSCVSLYSPLNKIYPCDDVCIWCRRTVNIRHLYSLKGTSTQSSVTRNLLPPILHQKGPGHKNPQQDHRNVLNYIMVMVAQLRTFTKNHCIIYLKQINFIVNHTSKRYLKRQWQI